MRHIGLRHPPFLCSLAFVRTRPELEVGSLISSLALFTVARRGSVEASFDVTHIHFEPNQDREGIIADLSRIIPAEAQLLVRQPWSEYLSAWSGNSGAGLPLLDNERIARSLPRTTLLPLFCSDEQIESAGELLGLEKSEANLTSLMRSRNAPVEAMALWSIYLRNFCNKTEVRKLLAAFHAWHVLDRIRTLPH